MKVHRRPGSTKWWACHYAGGKTYRKSMRTADKREAQKRARKWAQGLDEFHSVARTQIMLSQAVDDFTRHRSEVDLAKTTIRGYRGRLTQFLARNGDEDVSTWSEDTAYDKVSGYLRHRAGLGCQTKHERVILSTFFNHMRARRWYKGANPADAKLHLREGSR